MIFPKPPIAMVPKALSTSSKILVLPALFEFKEMCRGITLCIYCTCKLCNGLYAALNCVKFKATNLSSGGIDFSLRLPTSVAHTVCLLLILGQRFLANSKHSRALS